MSARPPCLPLILGALACAALGGCDRQASPPVQPSSAQPSSAQPSSEAAAPAGDANSAAGKVDLSHKGAAMPTFSFAGPDGAKISSKDLAGKPVLINLWATWCGPCVIEMPTLDKLAAGGLRVLTVSQDSAGQADKVKGFKAEHGLGHVQMLLDPDNDLSFHYNTGVLPTTVVYNAEGKEVGRVVGAFDWTGPEAAALIKAAS